MQCLDKFSTAHKHTHVYIHIHNLKKKRILYKNITKLFCTSMTSEMFPPSDRVSLPYTAPCL